MKIRLIRAIIGWLYQRYPYICMDVVLPKGTHIHRDPVRKRANQAVLAVTE